MCREFISDSTAFFPQNNGKLTHSIRTSRYTSEPNHPVGLLFRPAPCLAIFREFWADVQLAVSVEIITQNFQLAQDLFAETILVEAKGCQGSNQLLLRRVVIDYPLRQVQFILFRCLSLTRLYTLTPVHERIPH